MTTIPTLAAPPAAELATFEATRERFESEHDELVPALIDTADVSELRRRHPELFGDLAPAELADAYARQVDELAAIVDQYDAAHRRYTTVLRSALGDLHVALDELATLAAAQTAGGAR